MKANNIHCLMAAVIITLAACAGESPETGAPAAPKTALSIGEINVTTTRTEPGSSASLARAAAEDFFLPGDIITLTAQGTPTGESPETGSPAETKFTRQSTGAWSPTPGATPIYLEDVHNGTHATHTLTITFGSPQADQSTDDAFHQADQLSGDAALVMGTDGRPTSTVHAETLTRQGILVTLNIKKGKYWKDDKDFNDFIDNHHARFICADGTIIPHGLSAIYLPDQLPASGATIFELRDGNDKPIATCKWQNDGEAPGAGVSIIITATLNKEAGEMGIPEIKINPWVKEKDHPVLPGDRDKETK